MGVIDREFHPLPEEIVLMHMKPFPLIAFSATMSQKTLSEFFFIAFVSWVDPGIPREFMDRRTRRTGSAVVSQSLAYGAWHWVWIGNYRVG
jgi:hypothetical protein